MISAVMVRGVPDKEQRRCFDCKYCKATASWWCTNAAAVESSGSSIPGYKDCKFWAPTHTIKELGWIQRIFGDHIKIRQDKKETK